MLTSLVAGSLSENPPLGIQFGRRGKSSNLPPTVAQVFSGLHRSPAAGLAGLAGRVPRQRAAQVTPSEPKPPRTRTLKIAQLKVKLPTADGISKNADQKDAAGP